jgi:hypothetical protein
MKAESKTIKVLLSVVAFLLVLNLGVGLIHEKTAKAGKPIEYGWAASGSVYPFSNDESDSTNAMNKFTEILNSSAKTGWRVNSVASAVSASNPSTIRIYAIMER